MAGRRTAAANAPAARSARRIWSRRRARDRTREHEKPQDAAGRDMRVIRHDARRTSLRRPPASYPNNEPTATLLCGGERCRWRAYRARISIILPIEALRITSNGASLQQRERTHGHPPLRLSAVAARASADWFTGTVWQDPIVEDAGARRACAPPYVRFEPGARTNWHTHPLGQTLYIVSGAGRVQSWGGPRARRPRRRRGVVSAQREALARRRPDDDHGAHRHPRGARRQARRVARAGDRRAIHKAAAA